MGAWGEFRSANTVCIKHAHGEYTVYGHLKHGSITVKVGQKVKAGQVIGRVGNSGSSTYPHLHFAMYNGDGISLPCTFVDFTEVTRDGKRRVDSGRVVEGKVYANTFGKSVKSESGR